MGSPAGPSTKTRMNPKHKETALNSPNHQLIVFLHMVLQREAFGPQPILRSEL